MPAPETTLECDLKRSLHLWDQVREQSPYQLALTERGVVTSISMATATVSGLPGVRNEELLEFPGAVFGLAFNLDADEIGVVLLGDTSSLAAGMEVRRTGRVMDIPVGDGLLGRVIDPTAHPLDGLGAIAFSQRWPIERPAPAIIDRAPVSAPLQTGIKVVDAAVPIGRGQRQLILGDRQTGKTAIALDTILNQKDQKVICVYCAIGQRSDSVAKLMSVLRTAGALAYTVVVVAEGETPPGLKFIAPYAATSIAEYFMEQGQDALVIYDDLSQHARAYREMSLLLRRPPGREAFPGDIFYIHARLLERATHLLPQTGTGSLTALPIVETEAQNIAGYIPTNLISITDGQIYLSPDLFQKGILPAVDVGKSVSRVGGKAQLPAFRSIAGDLKLAYSQFEELEMFSRFATRLDQATRKTLAHGERVRECLRQEEHDLFSVPEQMLVLLALTAGLLDDIAIDRIAAAEQALREAARQLPAAVREQLMSKSALGAEQRQTVLSVAETALRTLKGRPHE
ncbi:MAG: alternate F1F0 ATPase, F1 subunit alpha [Limisphaerales bacterium]